jgi:hypothetical protein
MVSSPASESFLSSTACKQCATIQTFPNAVRKQSHVNLERQQKKKISFLLRHRPLSTILSFHFELATALRPALQQLAVSSSQHDLQNSG